MGNRLLTAVRRTALALTVFASSPSFGAILYAESFEADPTANWTVNASPTDAAADFFFDYSTVGISSAPSAPGTRGMKLQANQFSGIFGGMSVSPNGEDFGGSFTLRFDWWANFNGPFPAGGSGSTQLSTFGVGTSGTTAQWPGTQDSIWFGATVDGNSSSDWRAYSPTAPTRYADTTAGIYTAGAFAGSTDAADANYAGLGSNAAPAAQLALFPEQSGTTLVGSAGMAWHVVEIAVGHLDVTWTVDGLLIATVPLLDDTVNMGNNIFFGHSDTNGTSSNDPNDSALLFTLIDNISVTDDDVAVSEPQTLALLALGLAGFVCFRRRQHLIPRSHDPRRRYRPRFDRRTASTRAAFSRRR